MKRKGYSKVSLGDVAKAAGLSKTSAACALKNLPGVSKETRRRVRHIAKRLNYFPDPRLTSRMAGIRHTAAKDLLPVIWLNSNREKNAWQKYKFLSPYLEGARERCLQLGYKIEEIWARDPEFSMRRIARIIENQGIEGIIITDPARHVRLHWERLAGVSIGGGLLVPHLHQVTTDVAFNLTQTFKALKRMGRRRIGLCMTEQADSFSHHDVRAVTLYFNSTIPKAHRMEPLFTPYTMKPEMDTSVVAAWIKRQKPDAIIGLSSRLIEWVEAAGLRVPQDVAVAHLAIEDDVLDWAGIYANKREMGRLAADKLISLITSRQFGIPAIASTTLVPGIWSPGRTVLS
ncbi:MAG: LacI family transcriptional regulator [Methylacidiphilales bacterium]|nr:LacI family transcriptional regulator [Candidatus Methylacidiphilales bacterium]